MSISGPEGPPRVCAPVTSFVLCLQSKVSPPNSSRNQQKARYIELVFWRYIKFHISFWGRVDMEP